jgi:acetylornithine deacetylase/succinyl-diaminopimelate desuccinylase-like protein
VSALAIPLTDRLIQCLSTLCAQPTGAGQIDDLRAGAELIAGQLRGIGMHVRSASTAGAPVVLARAAGRSPRSLLLYHRYDTAPPGPWRDWSHEPFQLAERDGAVYARGVAEGKGPLAAHIQALHTIMQAAGGLPCGVVLVAEGHGMHGSQHLADVLAAHADILQADACLASQGERDAQGTPLCYSGCKGHLQVRLQARGGTYPLSAGMAPTLRNPLWRLAWALACIKGDDEDIRIENFYDVVEGPTRTENAQLSRIGIDERNRLMAWQREEFLFAMSGPALVRAEATLPTCNLSAIVCEPAGDMAIIPAVASAVLDFQLVPHQHPDKIFALLLAHLHEHGFSDVAVERVPGGYAPAHTPYDAPFIRQVAEASGALYGAPLNVVPAGPFTLPLQLFADGLGAPTASVGLNRPDSAAHGPDEHIPLDDLLHHAQLLGDLLESFAAGQS